MKQAFEALNIVGNTALLSMLYILTPECALSFIIYRIYLFSELIDYFRKTVPGVIFTG